MISIKSISPVKELKDALELNMKPKSMDTPPLGVSSHPVEVLKSTMPMTYPPKHSEPSDKEMVLNRLRSINRMSEILERMACGCEPMPSWAEAKIYSAAKDLQGVLGYLLGK